ncbi:hypothetical protein [Streptomyces sp. NPDC058297]|uniref:hypothetical protein n=1 Tax=Streptomyces sp. NPDC058297 TaxID=3346433 RepID=UPI0036E51B95
MTLSGQLQDAGVQLELLTGPLTGIYDPNGMGAMFFAVLAIAAQLDRNYSREKTLEGQQTGRRRGPPRRTAQGHRRRHAHLRRRAEEQGRPRPRHCEEAHDQDGQERGAPPPRSPRCTGRSPKPRKPPSPTTDKSSAPAARSAPASRAPAVAPTRS